MRLPFQAPAALRQACSPFHVLAQAPQQGIVAQGPFDWLPPLPIPPLPVPIPIPGGEAVKCAACCAGKPGFAACVARCMATGQACDGGVNNCTPC
jgi:hypothetical protein